MALGQPALLELLGELKVTDVTDRIPVATETLYPELIDAEAAAARSRPRPEIWGCGSPSCGKGVFFPSLLERRRHRHLKV